MIKDLKNADIASRLLERCAIFDSRTPVASTEVVMAWAMMIEQAFATWTRTLPRSGHYGFNEDDLIGAVMDWYVSNSTTATVNDLIKGARKRWQDRFDAGDPVLAAQYEELCNSKAAPDELEDEYPTPDPYAQVEKRTATYEERKAIANMLNKAVE